MIASFLGTPFLAFFFARAYVFDVMFIHAFGYAALGWLPVQPAERKAFYAEYRRWATQVATLP